jgi:5-methylcytosine-specific restriction endonuclease McrA
MSKSRWPKVVKQPNISCYSYKVSILSKKAHHHTYWLMTRWLAKKYKLRIPDVMQKFKQGSTFRTATLRMVPAQEYKARRYPPRVLRNPYTSQEDLIREELPVWEEWMGSERRKGEMDLKEEIYLRDQGMCGQCGVFVPWDAAHLDHIKPRQGFKQAKEADRWKNLQILHAEPCHREKTIQDLQVLSRMKGKLSCAALNGACGETGQARHRAPH